MDKRTLERTIDTLSKVVTLSEEQKKSLYDKYIEMPEKEVIKDLSKKAYEVVGPDSPYYDYVLTIIVNIKPSICPTVDKLKELLAKLYTNTQDSENKMSLEENHQLITSSLSKYCALFNQFNIDYYVVGALPCFIKAGIPLFRYHDDIDFLINEKDIDNVREIMEAAGYHFIDDRFPTVERFNNMDHNKTPHTIQAQNPNSEFHIGFFPFRREPDQTITVCLYSHRLVDGRVVTDVKERRDDQIGSALRYGDPPVSFGGTTFRSEAIESVYIIKDYTKRPKDVTDMEKLAPHLDKEKLEELKKHPHKEVTIEDVGLRQGEQVIK